MSHLFKVPPSSRKELENGPKRHRSLWVPHHIQTTAQKCEYLIELHCLSALAIVAVLIPIHCLVCPSVDMFHIYDPLCFPLNPRDKWGNNCTDMDLELDMPLPVSLQCFRVWFASASVEISGQQSSGLARTPPPQLRQVGRGVIHKVWLSTVTDTLRSQPSVSLIASTYLREQRKLCKINSINNKSSFAF